MKISVFEDNPIDFFSYYNQLIDDNEVIAYMISEKKQEKGSMNLLKIGGFNDVRSCSDLVNEINNGGLQSDLFFIDGLETINEKCFSLLKYLPKEKTYVVTKDKEIRDKADLLGYNTIDKEIVSINSVVNDYTN